jgi:hypothetical protein
VQIIMSKENVMAAMVTPLRRVLRHTFRQAIVMRRIVI